MHAATMIPATNPIQAAMTLGRSPQLYVSVSGIWAAPGVKIGPKIHPNMKPQTGKYTNRNGPSQGLSNFGFFMNPFLL